MQGAPTISGPEVVWHKPELVFELLDGGARGVVVEADAEHPGPQSSQCPM